jgi:hypothetical protein
MHSEKITLFEPETSRLKKAGAGTYGNSFIAIRRCAHTILRFADGRTALTGYAGCVGCGVGAACLQCVWLQLSERLYADWGLGVLLLLLSSRCPGATTT